MKLKLSLLASLAASVLCASGIASATPLDKKFSAEQQVAYESYTAPTNADQLNKQQLDAANDSVQQGVCNEGNQQQVFAWTIAPAVISSAPQMQTTTGEQKASRFDTGQVNTKEMLSAKAEAVASYASGYYNDSASAGSWAKTAFMPAVAPVQHQQPAAGYIKT